MAKSDKQILDIETINIFNHPRYMKVWAQRFSKACGSDTFNVAPDTIALRYLMEKFVKDYNFHLEGLEEE